MIETGRPTSVLNIDGELVRSAPITSRRLFSDALDLAPGVGSRNVDDGVGRRAYYFRGSHIYAHAFQLEGAPASSFLDSSAHSMGMGGDAIADSELKLGGVDAAAPMGTGVVMNVMTPPAATTSRAQRVTTLCRATGTATTPTGASFGGLPTIQSVQHDPRSAADRQGYAWFFATSSADLTNGISRSAFNLANLEAFQPGFQPFDNFMKSNQPFVKLTAQIKPSQQLTGFYQGDRARYTSNRELDTNLFQYNSTGGGLYQGKLNSVWNNRLTTQVSASYNNKSGNDIDTYNGVDLNGPQIAVHNDIFINRGIPTGTGILVQKNTPTSIAISPASMLVLRGDLTYFQEAWGGSHEFKTGIYAAPRLKRDTTTNYVNDGFDLQETRQIDPSNPAAGTVVWHERFRTPAINPSIVERDSDIAFYAQDAWKPHPRVTANVGCASIASAGTTSCLISIANTAPPSARLGVASSSRPTPERAARQLARLFEQVNGRDYIVQFGNTGGVTTTDLYTDKAGVKTAVVTPPTGRWTRGCCSTRASISPGPTNTSSDSASSSPHVQRRHRRDAPHLSRPVRAGRHQRPLSVRTVPAVRRVRPDRSEPGDRLQGNQRRLDAGGGQQPRRDHRQEHVAQLPDGAEPDQAVATSRGHVESDRPGAVHPAGGVRQRSRSLDAVVR